MQYAFMLVLVSCLLLGVFFYQDFTGGSTGGFEPTGWMSGLAKSISNSMNAMSKTLGF